MYLSKYDILLNIIYVDIMTGEKLTSSISIDDVKFIYWSVCSSSRRGGEDKVKAVFWPAASFT